jgi:hypothetical protein
MCSRSSARKVLARNARGPRLPADRDIQSPPASPAIMGLDDDGVADDVLFDRRGDCAAVEKL